MKLKQQPADFHVEELTAVTPSASAGPFAFYRLEKRGWTTPDALTAVRRRWKVDARWVSYGGLKDRHAHTIQYLTIHNGPDRDLEHGGFTLTYLGRVDEPYTSEHIRVNRFALVLRSLSGADVGRAEAALPEVADVGVPNYFDDQRFGSVPADGGFVAREMVLGNFEGALRLALAAPYEHDRAQAKREKAVLTARWGDWAACKAKLPRGHARSIVDYLVHHPADFKGACARLRPELQGLYLSAWQSHLWNRMLDRWLTEHVGIEHLVPIQLKTGTVHMPRSVPAPARPEWDSLALPLPSARLKLVPAAPWAGVVTAVMAEEGIPLDQMRIRGLQRPYFSRCDRPGKLIVANLTWTAGHDELNRGRRKLELHFELPRGAYATMLVKRLTADPGAGRPAG